MKPNAAYRAACKRRGVSDSSDTTVLPAHLRPARVDSAYEGVRKGRAKQKVGMWGNLSQYYRTAATHDARWSATVSEVQA